MIGDDTELVGVDAVAPWPAPPTPPAIFIPCVGGDLEECARDLAAGYPVTVDQAVGLLTDAAGIAPWRILP